jgi:hypothetical protein
MTTIHSTADGSDGEQVDALRKGAPEETLLRVKQWDGTFGADRARERRASEHGSIWCSENGDGSERLDRDGNGEGSMYEEALEDASESRVCC